MIRHLVHNKTIHLSTHDFFPPLSQPIRHCVGENLPTIMPREVEQTQPFEQQIAHKIHSNLVLKKYQPPDKSAAASPLTERSTASTTAPLLRVCESHQNWRKQT